jgi:cGMP-dependent protein kinase 2
VFGAAAAPWYLRTRGVCCQYRLQKLQQLCISAATALQVMRRIVDETWQITYPPYLSPAAKELIGRLLERKPARRIGPHPCCAVLPSCTLLRSLSSINIHHLTTVCDAGMLNGRANDIKRHKWFEGLDWDALAARRLEPPRKPKKDSEKRIQEIMDAEANEEKPEEDPNELAECEVVFADF